MCQLAFKLQASILKPKAEVEALPGAVMHVTLLTPADFAVTPVVVSEIAGAECPAVLLLVWNGTMALAPSAVPATLVNAAVPQIGKGGQLCIVQMFAPVRVPLGTAEHLLDEAPAYIYGVFMGLPISP